MPTENSRATIDPSQVPATDQPASPGTGPQEPDSPDPQRAVSTSCISRAGPSSLIVIGDDGFIDSDVHGETGFYVDDMRIVSQLLLLVNGQRPQVQNVRRDHYLTHFEFTFKRSIPHLVLHIDYFPNDGFFTADARFMNSGNVPLPVEMTSRFQADHFDTFYVRFPPRPERGLLHLADPDRDGQSIRYDRLDGQTSKSFIRFSEQPQHGDDGIMRLTRLLQPGERWEVIIQAGFKASVPETGIDRSLDLERHRVFAGAVRVLSENPRFDSLVIRSEESLAVLTAHLDTGLYPYAGLPWFAVPFGRDGLITGFQTIAVNPLIMKGVLQFLASHQAQEVDAFRQAAPGKILHEVRRGETSTTGLNPFLRYYGSVDTTPLFVMAVQAYWHRTNDMQLLENLWPNVDLALHWLSEFGDIDGDGFVEYASDPGRGLVNQGWKDSSDSIVHADGAIARGPIALCEVQGYAYAAWRAGEELATTLGHEERARFCRGAADRLYERFNEVFWQRDMGIYALALDGDKKPCRVRASNMVHLPWCGITPIDRGKLVLDEALSDRLFSGWGIRTLAAGEQRYRPALYHRGPCWPHEMAIASWSAEAVQDYAAVRKIAEALLDTAEAFGFVLPELFCGYPRTEAPPVPYKSANPLQAWAAGAACGVIASVLGLRIDLPKREASVDLSGFPQSWAPTELHDLRLGDESLSLRIEPGALGKVGVKLISLQRPSISLHDRSTGQMLT